jgi:hypothetical protein
MNAKAVTASTIRQDKALQKKKKRNRMFMLGGAVLFMGAMYYLFKPFEGGITYGICKTFLELYVQNPRSLRLSTVDDFGDNVRIWFTQVDSFGEYRMEPIQCYFRYSTDADKKKYGEVSVVLDKVTVSRRELDPELVARFNPAIIGIIQNPPSLILPTALDDSLEDLQFDFGKFRKPIL